MMPQLYYVNVALHVLAAMLWLGGMFFLGVVGAPALRAIEQPALRQRLFQELGVRFRSVGWVAIAVLILTGLVNLHYRGWLHWDGVFASAAFWRTGVGTALAIKLASVTVMIIVSAVHDFALGPLAGRVEPGSPQAIAFRRRAALLARVNALLGVVVVVAAVRLPR
ncbi:MAG TPA: CopD family protein [Gemmatimonadaceae bacterium]|nr:CopD family protein [Gemmatimonadaceae bacterium]